MQTTRTATSTPRTLRIFLIMDRGGLEDGTARPGGREECRGVYSFYVAVPSGASAPVLGGQPVLGGRGKELKPRPVSTRQRAARSGDATLLTAPGARVAARTTERR